MFCPRCGHGEYIPGYYCTNCGYHQSQPIQPTKQAQQTQTQGVQPKQPVMSAQPGQQVQQPVRAAQPGQQVQQPVRAAQAQQQIQQPVYATCPLPSQSSTKRKSQPQKTRKKRSTKRFFAKLGIFIAVNALLVFLWFAFGNYLTLTLHSNQVVETINSGSLELNGVADNDYDQLPTYVQKLVEPPQQQNGPVVDMMLPHISIERIQVNGFLGASSVEYKVVAPDMEEWLLNLNDASITSQEQLLEAMENYVRSAPRAARKVTVVYHADGIFQWKGNYNTPEFLDAITGGLNTAYAKLYKGILEDMKETLQ